MLSKILAAVAAMAVVAFVSYAYVISPEPSNIPGSCGSHASECGSVAVAETPSCCASMSRAACATSEVSACCASEEATTEVSAELGPKPQLVSAE